MLQLYMCINIHLYLKQEHHNSGFFFSALAYWKGEKKYIDKRKFNKAFIAGSAQAHHFGGIWARLDRQ